VKSYRKELWFDIAKRRKRVLVKIIGE